jgi:hypothetical protein
MSGSTQIWFGTRAVDFTNPLTVNTVTGQQLETITSNTGFDWRSFAWGTFDNTGAAYHQLIAFMGTAAQQAALGINLGNGVDAATAGAVNTTGDLRVGSGVTGHNIADILGGGRLGDVSNLDQTNDVVLVGGFARVSNTAVGEAVVYDQTPGVNHGAFVSFTNATGFGLVNRNGWDLNGNATRLNDGDSVDFNIAIGNILSKVSFTVNTLNGAGSSAEVILDSDGQVIVMNGANFAQQNSSGELSLGALLHGTAVEVDYDAQTILINGSLFTGSTTSFFGAFVENGLNNITFGSKVVNTAPVGGVAVNGWSVDDLVLSFIVDDGGAGPGGTGAVLSFDWFTAGSDPAPTGLLNGRMYAYLDEDANNTLDASEVATARDMGLMRPGVGRDDPGAVGDDNPIIGAGGVQWLEMYALGMKNPTLAIPVPIVSGAQYGEHIGGNVATIAGDGSRFALSVHSHRHPAVVTPGGENGGPAEIDVDRQSTIGEDPTPNYINHGEILGFSLIAKNIGGTPSFANSAKITFAKGADLTPATTADIIVRLYNDSLLLETITYDITGTIASEQSGSFTVHDSLFQNFNRMEIEAAGSMNGVLVADAGARFVVTDLDFFLV